MTKAKQSAATRYFFPRAVERRAWSALLGRSFLLVCLLFASEISARDQQLQDLNALYQAVLNDYLSVGQKNGLDANMFDYAGVKNDQRLATLQQMLKDYPKEKLDTKPKQIAFYLNAYNILAIAKVAEHWPLYKLRSLGNYFKPVWTHPAGEVCQEKMTLRKLEHEILRKLDEPRIHFALNCASMSCPDLRREPYLASRLEPQLRDQTSVFMAQKNKGMALIEGELWLSSIFKWFEEDFEPAGGIYTFIQPYLPETAKGLEVEGYLGYDWSVNDHLTAGERNRIKRRDTWFN